MSLLTPWLLFPLVLGALCVGCGLLLERIASTRLSGALIAPVGFALMIVVAGFTTHTGGTAVLTIPAVVGLAAAGWMSGIRTLRGRRLLVPTQVGAAVFAVFAAPVVLSGGATFAGYIKLDDTATFLALTDRVLEHGPSFSGLAPSSYEATLAVNLGHSYPLGALLPLGVGHGLVGTDAAWLYQPYLAFAAALLALVLYELSGAVIPSNRLRAVVSIVAAQPALLYGYALWGGIKELVVAPLVALVAALTPTLFDSSAKPRRLLPHATAGAAVVGVLSAGGVVWLSAPAALAALLVVRRRAGAMRIAGLTVAFLLLSLPTLLDARSFFDSATSTAVRSSTELGNLVHPLNPLQVLGVWPTGDFRLTPSDRTVAFALLGAVIAAALLGLASAWRRRSTPLLSYLAAAGLAAGVMALFGSPWVAAKAFAIASPAFLLLALAGCAALVLGTRRTEGIVGLAIVGGGVLWSNALAYHEVNLAPRSQLAELELIGHRFGGDGPALMTEYEPYGVRHFLRRLDAEGASELRRRPVPLRDGTMLGKGAYADLASFQRSAVLVYRTLVLRRSPLASRPDPRYSLMWRGRFYDVWERDVVERRCASARTLAGLRSRPVVIRLGGYPTGTHEDSASFEVSHTGAYSLWIGGSFRDRLSAFVDGRFVGSRQNQLNNAGQYTELGNVALTGGTHVVALRYAASVLAPGSGGPEYGLGPLVIGSAASPC